MIIYRWELYVESLVLELYGFNCLYFVIFYMLCVVCDLYEMYMDDWIYFIYYGELFKYGIIFF